MFENIAVIAGFAFLYSIIGGLLERTPVSGAIVFAAFGLAFGPLGLGLLDPETGAEGLRLLAELTLALVLFTDAAKSNLSVLRRNIRIPRRLLLMGLPLTILLGFGVGVFVFDGLALFEIALLATMLAPTDAALGKAVVADKSVPPQIRESLSVESGLNDGICVPVLLVFLALAAGTSAGVGEGETTLFVVMLVIQQIGIGVVAGLALAFIGHGLLRFCAGRGWLTKTWQQLPLVALAIVCFAAAQALGGSGFIAAFVGGLLFGWLAGRQKQEILPVAEGIGDTFALITWVIFGAAVVGQSIDDIHWTVVVYAVLSLTVVRIVPVLISLVGTELRIRERLFVGWFGPRGLASIVFAVMVYHQHLPGGNTLAITVVCTVALSIIAHGLSASPLVAALTRSGKA